MDQHGCFYPRPEAVPVLHPELRHFGRIWLDHDRLDDTQGLQRWMQFGERAHPPSICLLQQDSRCTAAERCNQIHIRMEFAEWAGNIIKILKDQDTCCHFHGDPASMQMTDHHFLGKVTKLLVHFGKRTWLVPHLRIALTRYWNGQVMVTPRGVVHISRHAVCKLHLRRRCQFGADCCRVHICRLHPDPEAVCSGEHVTPWNIIGRLGNIVPTITSDHHHKSRDSLE